MKVIVFSDTQIHPYKTHTRLDVEGRNVRLLEGVRALEQVARYTESHGSIAAALFCGDLFEHRDSLPTEAAVRVRRALAGFRCPVVGVPGNHDKLDDEINTLDAVWPWDEGCHVWDYWKLEAESNSDLAPVSCVGIKGLQIDAVGYQATQKETLQAISRYASKNRNYDAEYRILMLHDGIDGSLQGSESKPARVTSAIMLDKLPVDTYDAIFVGHIHIAQILRFNKPGALVLVPGSLTQQNFGDAGGQRGFWEVNLKNKSARQVLTTTTRFVVVQHSRVNQAQCDGAHCRIVFPPRTLRKDARTFCDRIIEAGAVTAEPDVLPDIASVVAPNQLVDGVELEHLLDEYVAAACSDDSVGKILLTLGRNILTEARDAEVA
jgi:DNA repair exonuclease SbcCD nuclease subunit